TERGGLLEEHGEEELQRVGLAAPGAADHERDAAAQHRLGRAPRLELGELAAHHGEEALERGLGRGADGQRAAPREELALDLLLVGGDASRAEDAIAEHEGLALGALSADELGREALPAHARAGVSARE